MPAAIVARELDIRLIETVCVASYHDYKTQGELEVLKGVADSRRARRRRRAGLLIVDDLVDTGKTAQVVRDMLPGAHFATVYAKPMGRPMVDTFITEVSQDTWIYFPWDTGLAFQPPIRGRGGVAPKPGGMPALVAGINTFPGDRPRTWMVGTRPTMTLVASFSRFTALSCQWRSA